MSNHDDQTTCRTQSFCLSWRCSDSLGAWPLAMGILVPSRDDTDEEVQLRCYYRKYDQCVLYHSVRQSIFSNEILARVMAAMAERVRVSLPRKAISCCSTCRSACAFRRGHAGVQAAAVVAAVAASPSGSESCQPRLSRVTRRRLSLRSGPVTGRARPSGPWRARAAARV